MSITIKNSKVVLLVVFLVSLVAIPPQMAAQTSYTITDLGPLSGTGGISSEAHSINDKGQIVGLAQDSSIPEYAFFWQANSGMQSINGNNSVAYSINNKGQTVGTAFNYSTQHSYTFMWQSGTGIQNLGTFGGNSSGPYSINDNGQIVGWVGYDSGYQRAFFWDSVNGLQNLGTFGGYNSVSYGVNNAGQVVGWAGDNNNNQHAFFWSTSTGMQNLGTLGGNTSEAFGINKAGQVVGIADNYGNNGRAFLWQSEIGMQDLGTLVQGNILNSSAKSINNNGQVVGWSDALNSLGTFSERAFLWQSSTGMQNLNNLIDPSSGWTLIHANDINDNGWIVGYGWNPTGQTHAFLLTPIPEPSTFVLLSMYVISFLAYVWRQHRKADSSRI